MRAFVIAAVLIAGCASAPEPLQWQRPGASEEDRIRDEAQCRAQAHTPTAGSPIVRPSATFARGQVRTLDFEACMRTQGWQPVRTPG